MNFNAVFDHRASDPNLRRCNSTGNCLLPDLRLSPSFSRFFESDSGYESSPPQLGALHASMMAAIQLQCNVDPGHFVAPRPTSMSSPPGIAWPPSSGSSPVPEDDLNMTSSTSFTPLGSPMSLAADLLEEIELIQSMLRPRNKLPDNYLCHLCFTKGHLIKHCSQARQQEEGKTPYQGIKRCFGQFKCPKCKRKWESANSWANEAQSCVKCKLDVYPYKQRPPKKDHSPEEFNLHPEQLCGRCKALGRYCRREEHQKPTSL